MVSFYFQTAAPVAKYYLQQALKNLDERAGEVSNIEWQRCLRAAYRFQLLCCAVKSARLIRDIHDDTLERLAERLFYTPEPWEGEELSSFYQFAEAVYEHISDDITAEVHPDNARFDDQDRPPTPEGAFELARFSDAFNCKAGTALRGGPDLLRVVLVYLKSGGDRETVVSFATVGNKNGVRKRRRVRMSSQMSALRSHSKVIV
ncbi:unnamed protein product [Discula destructiva]